MIVWNNDRVHHMDGSTIQFQKNEAELLHEEDDVEEAVLAIPTAVLLGVELARQDRLENQQSTSLPSTASYKPTQRFPLAGPIFHLE